MLQRQKCTAQFFSYSPKNSIEHISNQNYHSYDSIAREIDSSSSINNIIFHKTIYKKYQISLFSYFRNDNQSVKGKERVIVYFYSCTTSCDRSYSKTIPKATRVYNILFRYSEKRLYLFYFFHVVENSIYPITWSNNRYNDCSVQFQNSIEDILKHTNSTFSFMVCS